MNPEESLVVSVSINVFSKPYPVYSKSDYVPIAFPALLVGETVSARSVTFPSSPSTLCLSHPALLLPNP